MKITGVDRLRRKLAAIPEVARAEIRATMEKGAEEITDVMRRMVPVDEGRLKASIGWTWGAAPEGATVFAKAAAAEGLAITIYAGDMDTIVSNSRGAEWQNALLQEFGTKDRRARPFFRPAWRLTIKRVRGRITRSLGKAARQVAAGR